VLTRVGQVIDNVKALEKELARLKSKLAASQGDDLAGQAPTAGAKVLAATLEGADVATLRETLDKLKDKLKSAAIVLASVRRRQGQPDRRRHRRPDRQGQGRRAGQLGRPAGGRQGRRPPRHGPGRRHRRLGPAGGAGLGGRLGRRQAGLMR
jgi:alanyl-tRNA synthetase